MLDASVWLQKMMASFDQSSHHFTARFFFATSSYRLPSLTRLLFSISQPVTRSRRAGPPKTWIEENGVYVGAFGFVAAILLIINLAIFGLLK